MKMLLTGALSCLKSYAKEIQALGHDLIYIQDERISLTEQGIDVRSLEGIIGNNVFLYNDISEFKSLKYIQLTSVGIERIPMEYIKAYGIEVHNAQGVYSIPMSEFAIGGVLQIYKRAEFFYKNKKRHCWEKQRDLQELNGKVVGIIGCGSVGNECAKRFQAFGCKVLGIDLNPGKKLYYDSVLGINLLCEVLQGVDILILTLPLTDETKHLMNKKMFELLKKDTILVNISRGAIVDSEALTNALRCNLGGAVLDVFEEEPLSCDSPLWDMSNVIITPHNSFVGEGNNERLHQVIIDNLKQRFVK